MFILLSPATLVCITSHAVGWISAQAHDAIRSSGGTRAQKLPGVRGQHQFGVVQMPWSLRHDGVQCSVTDRMTDDA